MLTSLVPIIKRFLRLRRVGRDIPRRRDIFLTFSPPRGVRGTVMGHRDIFQQFIYFPPSAIFRIDHVSLATATQHIASGNEWGVRRTPVDVRLPKVMGANTWKRVGRSISASTDKGYSSLWNRKCTENWSRSYA